MARSVEPAAPPPDRVGHRLLFLVFGGGFASLVLGGTLLLLTQSGKLGPTGAPGPGRRDVQYQSEQAVQIWRNESWQPGSVLATAGERYRVRYAQSTVFADEWVDATRLRARPNP